MAWAIDNEKGKLFEDSRVSEAVSSGKNASVDENLSKPQVKRSLVMSISDICKFYETTTADEVMTVHNDTHIIPIG